MVVDIKIGGPGAVSGPDKKKPATRTGTAGGPSFASMLDAAGESAEAAPAAQAGLPSALPPLVDEDEDLPPRSGKQQAKDLMAGLSELADDVLAGNATGAAKKLEAYVKAEVADKASLSDEAKAVLDELATRAAVAAAKVKG
jgi:hypothetical protein